MSILTEEEIREMEKLLVLGINWNARYVGVTGVNELARAIESAVLAKLAGMELPWGDDIEAWLEVRTGAEIAAAFHQAFAQGAASQLAQKPKAWQREDAIDATQDFRFIKIDDFVVPLYTLKEPS